MFNKFDNNVVYQIYPKSFKDSNNDGIGDIKGILSKLDYLDDLGVDYIWLSPINKSPQYDNGYDISNYYEIDEIFGSKEDYLTLINRADKYGIKIMMDLVLNHVSSESEWFKKAVAGDEKYLNYFIWRDEPNELQSFFNTSAWTYEPKVGKYYLHLFDKHQPDLNWQNGEVRAEIYKMVNYWIDNGIKGFRLDVIDLIGKEPDKLITGKGPLFYDYLQELHENTFKDEILTVGECWNSSLEDSYKMCDGKGLTQVFHFSEQVTTNLENKWEQKPVDFNEIKDIIVKWHNEYKGSQTKVMNNHDLPRLVSLWLDDEEFHYESQTLLLMLFAMFRGTLYLYQGDEIGMTNDNKDKIEMYNDVESINKYSEYLRETELNDEEIMNKIKLISRDNARTPMQWNSEKYGGFSNTEPWLKMNYRYEQINVETDQESEKSIYNYTKALIKLRKDNYETMICEPIVEATFDNNILYFKRETYEMYFNMGEEIKELDLENKTVLLSNYHNKENVLNSYEVKIVKL